MKRKVQYLFLVLFLITLCVPLGGMLFYTSDAKIENRELASWPTWSNEDGFNTSYLSEMGSYFEDYYAFKQELISINASIRSSLFQTGSSQVILGKEDWLFYQGTLEDFQGTNVLSDRQVSNITHNLKLVQDNVEANGAIFAFTIAPNKNSLYPQMMPDYTIYTDNQKNYQKVGNALVEGNINYINLYDAFNSVDTPLYLKKDSHWNGNGAMLASNTILSGLNKEVNNYEGFTPEIVASVDGDVNEMLYSSAATSEEDYSYQLAYTYQEDTNVETYMDEWIETSNPDKDGTLLMYRDSFGESLTPFLAQEMNKSYFSRYTPYYIDQMHQYRPDYVVIEIVERNIIDLLEKTPIMQTTSIVPFIYQEIDSQSSINMVVDGGYLIIEGQVDKTLQKDDNHVYVEITDSLTGQQYVFPTFFTSDEDGNEGYRVYINKQIVLKGTTVRILVSNSEGNFAVEEVVSEIE